MNNALGMIEVRGYSASIEVLDTMLKVANVQFLDTRQTNGNGWMSVVIAGDVAAVQASIKAAEIEAVKINSFVASNVIARPNHEVSRIIRDFARSESKEELKTKEETEIIQPTTQLVTSSLALGNVADDYTEIKLNESREKQKKHKKIAKKTVTKAN